MMKEFKFQEIIENIIREINSAKENANAIHHAGNIKSSGDEIENLIRDKISLFLPERYLVKQGHIINSDGQVSHQFDIIIFDRLNTPKFFETRNNTVFYPIESVLAVGEIKKTLRRKDLMEFGKKIKHLKVDMKRQLIENIVYLGKLSSHSKVADMVTMGIDRKYKNPLFAFMFAIDEEQIDELEISPDGRFMPDRVYVLNYGFYFLHAKFENGGIVTSVEDEDLGYDGLIATKRPGMLCLATMFHQLIDHLNKCYIEPFGLSSYMTDPAIYALRATETNMYRIIKPPSESSSDDINVNNGPVT